MRILLSSLVIALASLAAHADIVHLINGGKLEGKVIRKGGKVYIEQPCGVVIIDEERVDHIEKKITDLEIFEDGLAKVDEQAKDAAEQFAVLGQWASGHGLKHQAATAYRRAIEMNPEHERARAALGYTKYQGAWMTNDELQEARGMVRHGETWVSPEAHADLLRLEAATQLEKSRAETERLRAERTALEVQRAGLEAEMSRGPYGPEYGVPIFGGFPRPFRHGPPRPPLFAPPGPGDRVHIGPVSPLGAPAVNSDGSTAPARTITPAFGLRAPTVELVPQER